MLTKEYNTNAPHDLESCFSKVVARFSLKKNVTDALERRKAELDNIQGQFNVRLDGIKDELSRIEETINRFEPPERDQAAIAR